MKELVKEAGRYGRYRDLNRYFDHTMLRPEASQSDILHLCAEARKYDFYAVCVNSGYVSFAREMLQGSPVKICSVVGFPLGACAGEIKLYEAVYAAKMGAVEIDMVMNIAALKSGEDGQVRDEIAAVAAGAAEYGAEVKVIIEAGMLSDEEIFRSCFLARGAGAAYVKTSTGFLGSGASPEQIALMRKAVGNDCGVKASGGITTLDATISMIEAGASRIGASRSVEIMKEMNRELYKKAE